MLRFACPACRAVLSVPEAAAGKKGSCPKCGQRLQVPAPPGAIVLGELLPEPPAEPAPLPPEEHLPPLSTFSDPPPRPRMRPLALVVACALIGVPCLALAVLGIIAYSVSQQQAEEKRGRDVPGKASAFPAARQPSARDPVPSNLTRHKSDVYSEDKPIFARKQKRLPPVEGSKANDETVRREAALSQRDELLTVTGVVTLMFDGRFDPSAGFFQQEGVPPMKRPEWEPTGAMVELRLKGGGNALCYFRDGKDSERPRRLRVGQRVTIRGESRLSNAVSGISGQFILDDCRLLGP